MRTVVEEYRYAGNHRVAIVIGTLLTLLILAVVAYRAIFHGDPLLSDFLIVPAISIAIVLHGVIGSRRAKNRAKKIEWLKSVATPIIPVEIKAVFSQRGSWSSASYGRILAFNVVCTFIDTRGNLRDTKRTKFAIGGIDGTKNTKIPPLDAEIYVNPDDFEDYVVVLYWHPAV